MRERKREVNVVSKGRNKGEGHGEEMGRERMDMNGTYGEMLGVSKGFTNLTFRLLCRCPWRDKHIRTTLFQSLQHMPPCKATNDAFSNEHLALFESWKQHDVQDFKHFITTLISE